MATLETQYSNFLKENPESSFTFKEWLNWKFSKIKSEILNLELDEWDNTLADGLEPFVSDDFQIGPSGAYEHSEREIDFQGLLKSVSSKLKIIPYNNGDISDLGNEIGIAVGKAIKDMTESEVSQFISGFRHGISLTNNTH